MKHKILKVIFVIATVLAIGLCAFACNEPSSTDPAKYAVTYAGGEGAVGTAPSGGEYAQGTEITLPTAGELVKTNHTFGGWSYGGSTYNAGDKFTVPANAVEFTAVWIENQGGGETPNPPATTYGVTYNINGAAGTAPTESAKAQGEKFNLADSAGLSNPDHTFGGWSYDGHTYDAGAEFTMPANAVTFTAVWNLNQPTAYTLSYATNPEQGSGTAPAGVQKYEGDEIELPANTWFATILPNYEFKGWYIEGNYNVTYQPGDSFTMPAQNVTFMAKWGAITHTVTYKAGEHAAGADKVLQGDKGYDITLKSLAELGNPFTVDTSDDYVFVGWKIEGDSSSEIYKVGDNYELNGDVVFIAQWEIATQIGFYDTNMEAILLMTLNVGNGEIQFADGTKVQFTFEIDGERIAITLDNGETFNGTFANNTVNITITYGHTAYTFPYVAPSAPTVSFDANGGTGNAPAEIVPTEVGDTYRFTTPANTFTSPENCEFKAWMLIVNGVEKGEYKENVKIFANAGETVVLKAIWQSAVTNPAELVTYIGNCTTPIVNAMFSQGGETYIKFVIDFDNNTVEYYFSDETHASATLLDSDLGAVKPDEYGADSLYFKATMGKKGNGKVNYYFLVAADKSKLYLCNSDDELIANGEFTMSNGNEEESGFVLTALADVDGKRFTTSDGSAFYSDYVSATISWNPNFGNYILKFTKSNGLSRSYNIDASSNNQDYSSKNFAATYSTSSVVEFGFEKDGDNFILVITKIYSPESPETNLITEEVRLTEAQ